MKFDSIKSRLLLMTLICVVGMLTLVVSQHFINKKLISLNHQKAELLRLKSELLQLRRNEKDFLLRGEMRYVTQFTEGMEAFKQDLSALAQVYSEYGLDTTSTSEIRATVDRYDALFMQVVTINRKLGLTEKKGLRAQFDEGIQSLRGSAQSEAALLKLSLAQIAERDMLLNYSMAPVDSFEAATASLSPSDFAISDAQTALENTATVFLTMAEYIQQMGETQGEGLRGEFRRQAHLVESRLASVDDKLTPVITHQEERIRQYSLLIATLTCFILVFILVKSFATFHRAFAYFVMFFYQCKREFQHIDPKKLGFSEFRSLAELANEMVEARKHAERQLADAQRQLKNQRGS